MHIEILYGHLSEKFSLVGPRSREDDIKMELSRSVDRIGRGWDRLGECSKESFDVTGIKPSGSAILHITSKDNFIKHYIMKMCVETEQ
jgi:hypothetical protein